MNAYIDAHRETFGVEPICPVLQVAPSTYYAARTRPPSARSVTGERLKIEIVRVFRANYRCYGVRKVWRQLRREQIVVARCTVARLMCRLGLAGLVRGETCRTTIADATCACLLVRCPELTAGWPTAASIEMPVAFGRL